jgi:hypothetical protein
MGELVRTNDPALLAVVEALLQGAELGEWLAG